MVRVSSLDGVDVGYSVAVGVAVVVVVVAPEGRRSRPQNLMSTNVQAEFSNKYINF